MHGHPENGIVLLVLIGVGSLAAYRALLWLFSGPLTPDPWGEQIAVAMDAPESARVCHRCLTEHSDLNHFCPKCGAAVGDYNNLLPFEQIFSEGEVFRNGMNLKTKRSLPVVVGYILISLFTYNIFAPVYWIVLFKNLSRPQEVPPTNEPRLEG